jgi:hypothetical protein
MIDSTAYYVVAIIGSVIGMTWALRTKLADIEVAVKGHIAEDKIEHESVNARIIKLESRRRK